MHLQVETILEHRLHHLPLSHFPLGAQGVERHFRFRLNVVTLGVEPPGPARNLKIPNIPAEPDQVLQAVIAGPKSAVRGEAKRLIRVLTGTRLDGDDIETRWRGCG